MEAAAQLITIFSLEKKDLYLFEKVLSNTPCNLQAESKTHGPFSPGVLNICLVLAIQNKNIQLVNDLIKSGHISSTVALICGGICHQPGFLDLFMILTPSIDFSAIPLDIRLSYIFTSKQEGIMQHALQILNYPADQQALCLKLLKILLSKSAHGLALFLEEIRDREKRVRDRAEVELLSKIRDKIKAAILDILIENGDKDINSLLSIFKLSQHDFLELITHAKIQGQHKITQILIHQLERIKHKYRCEEIAIAVGQSLDGAPG